MRSVGLKPGGGIGIRRFVIVEAESIARTGSRAGDDSAKMTIRFAREGMFGIADHDADRAVVGSPHPNVGAGWSQFGAYGALPFEHRKGHDCKQRATYV